MDYPFENLDPERFQQFCQALLIRSHPNLQCFPVAQPDGGRDALEPLELDAIHFQVAQQYPAQSHHGLAVTIDIVLRLTPTPGKPFAS